MRNDRCKFDSIRSQISPLRNAEHCFGRNDKIEDAAGSKCAPQHRTGGYIKLIIKTLEIVWHFWYVSMVGT